ncbi:MAG: mannitol dehydrogenase family protein [Rhodobacteraceae bacterium]|nr:mannitol dehydrogenase family protein [Paracoccaceae bacterium]
MTRAKTPGYDRAALTPGLVHFGVGNFHRAHQAAYLDRLFSQGRDLDWAVIGTGVTEADRAMRADLLAQDCLFTLVSQSAEESRARVIGAMVDYLPVGEAAAIIAQLADPRIRIVSLTVTEGGYFLDGEERFNLDHPVILAEAAGLTSPRTVFGLIAAGLRSRRAEGAAPFTVMSCDNIPHNGAVTRNAVAGVARLSDPELAGWIETAVAFPNGMVDRITPATGDAELAAVVRDHDIADRRPVFCEDFSQWVLEDHFPAGRPALEDVGVEFVPDVAPYERMKIRILNGGHAVLAYPAALLEIEYAHQAMADPLIWGFLDKVEREEILPTVSPPPGVDAAGYLQVIERRFANPKIADQVRRLCYDGANRQPKFILPIIADRLAEGEGVEGLALASALWCRYCAGETESGAPIAPNDPNWTRLTQIAQATRNDPAAWLAMEEVYGSLGQAAAFQADFAAALTAMWRDGVAETLRRYLAGVG